MARSRNIKPGFFKNEELAELNPLARLLYAGLWCLADREGRLEDRPKRIKAEILPYENCNIDDLLNELYSAYFIIRYEVNDERYICIPNWHKHQNPHHKEVKSEIPPYIGEDDLSMSQAYSKHESSMSHGQVKQIASCPTDSLNLIPDSLYKHGAADLRLIKIVSDKLGRLALTPKDSEVVMKWLHDKIPEEIVLRGIEKAINNFTPKFDTDKIRSAHFFDPFIRELHAEATKPESPEERRQRKANACQDKEIAFQQYMMNGGNPDEFDWSISH